jgi:hypothetical protein
MNDSQQYMSVFPSIPSSNWTQLSHDRIWGIVIAFIRDLGSAWTSSPTFADALVFNPQTLLRHCLRLSAAPASGSLRMSIDTSITRSLLHVVVHCRRSSERRLLSPRRSDVSSVCSGSVDLWFFWLEVLVIVADDSVPSGDWEFAQSSDCKLLQELGRFSC